jgi:hypothetical protein
MRTFRLVVVLTVIGALAVSSGSAFAASSLILKAGGKAAPVGTPATGVLEFGPCGTLKSSGTLTVNEQPTDIAQLPTVESEGGGGCGEGGPSATGRVTSIKATSAGHLTASGKITYSTTLPRKCVYMLTKMTGRFSIPGFTQARVAGVGVRAAGSEPGCAEKLRVGADEEVEARLYDRSTGSLFEAEL